MQFGKFSFINDVTQLSKIIDTFPSFPFSYLRFNTPVTKSLSSSPNAVTSFIYDPLCFAFFIYLSTPFVNDITLVKYVHLITENFILSMRKTFQTQKWRRVQRKSDLQHRARRSPAQIRLLRHFLRPDHPLGNGQTRGNFLKKFFG